MSQVPLDLLTCPDCGPGARLAGAEEGGLSCPSCGRRFEIRGRVLDLAPKNIPPLTRETATQFGDSWSSHEFLAPYQERQFFDWIAPLKQEDFAGKVVLDAGCGKGRHSFLVAGYRPAHLYCADLSNAIFITAEYVKGFAAVTPIRADLHKLPMASSCADLVMCLGVLHHLEDPKNGLAELWRVLAPGGTLCLWVYAREGNDWVVRLVDPVRRGITSRISLKWLRPLAFPLSLALFLALKLLYAPSTREGKRAARWLPYSTYLGYISRFPFREIEHIVLDHLCPPIALYFSRPQIEAWFSELAPADLQLRWHNRNSWNVTARKAPPA